MHVLLPSLLCRELCFHLPVVHWHWGGLWLLFQLITLEAMPLVALRREAEHWGAADTVWVPKDDMGSKVRLCVYQSQLTLCLPIYIYYIPMSLLLFLISSWRPSCPAYTWRPSASVPVAWRPVVISLVLNLSHAAYHCHCKLQLVSHNFELLKC